MAAILSTSFAAPVTDWAATWSLVSVTGVQVGHLCAAESELAQVTNVGPGTTVTVRRGVEATSAAAHATGTPVAVSRAGDVDTDAPVLGSAAVSPRQVTVTLSDAQVKALPGGAVEGVTVIVPPPGVNRVILPLSVVTLANFSSAGYTNVASDANLAFLVGTLSDYWNVTATMRTHVGTFLTQTALRVLPFPLETRIQEVGTTDTFYVEPQGVFEASVIGNQPLQLYAYNTLGNFTGGHAANTLAVSVIYHVFDLTTGVYV